MASPAAIALNRALLGREIPDLEPPSVRVAAYVFIAQGVLSIILVMVYAGGVVGLVNAVLSFLIGFGVLQRRRFWRFIGALGAGSTCGGDLAYFGSQYWPFGAQAWDWQLFVGFLFWAVAGWQLWALTNRNAQYYFRPRFPEYVPGTIPSI
jgi:hypothetical protein